MHRTLIKLSNEIIIRTSNQLLIYYFIDKLQRCRTTWNGEMRKSKQNKTTTQFAIYNVNQKKNTVIYLTAFFSACDQTFRCSTGSILTSVSNCMQLFFIQLKPSLALSKQTNIFLYSKFTRTFTLGDDGISLKFEIQNIELNNNLDIILSSQRRYFCWKSFELWVTSNLLKNLKLIFK